MPAHGDDLSLALPLPGFLDLADYRAVALLVTTDTMREAARRFGATQPALSMRLARIEERLGQALFVRSAAGLRPTKEAVRLGRAARRILAAAASAEATALASQRASLPARLVVGATPCAEHTVLPAVARCLGAKAEVCVHTMSGSEQARALHEGGIDVGISYLPLAGRAAAAFSFVELTRHEVRCAVPSRHASAPWPDPLPWDRLASLGFILFAKRLSPALHAAHRSLLLRLGLRVCAEHDTDRIETTLQLVAQGRGAALVPAWAEELGGEGVCFRALPAPRRTVAMGAVVTRKGAGPRVLGELSALGLEARGQGAVASRGFVC